MVGIADRVSGGGVLQPDDGDDVAGVRGRHVLTVVGVHLQDPTDPLLAVLRGVGDVRAGAEHTGVHTQVRQPADEGIRHDLEGQGRERLRVLGRALDVRGLIVGEVALHREHLGGRRKVGDDRVEQGLDTLVLEGGAAHHRNAEARERRSADRAMHLLDRGLLLVDELLHQGLVVVGEPLEEDVVGRLRGGPVLLRDLGVVPLLAHVALPVVGVHLDEVDHAVEVGLCAPRELQDERGRLEAIHDHVDGALEVGTGPIHLIDETDPGDLVAVRLAPHGLGLRLHARHGVEHGDGAVEDAEGPLDLDREIDVAGRVDDVDPVALPLARGGRRRDRDPALALLDHPVHLRGPFVHLADLVGLPGVVEDPLGRGGLPGVDVRHDADVARASEGVLADREPLAVLHLLFGLRHLHPLCGDRHQEVPSTRETGPLGPVGWCSSITIGNARTLGWPRPSCACPRAA